MGAGLGWAEMIGKSGPFVSTKYRVFRVPRRPGIRYNSEKLPLAWPLITRDSAKEELEQ